MLAFLRFVMGACWVLIFAAGLVIGRILYLGWRGYYRQPYMADPSPVLVLCALVFVCAFVMLVLAQGDLTRLRRSGRL